MLTKTRFKYSTVLTISVFLKVITKPFWLVSIDKESLLVLQSNSFHYIAVPNNLSISIQTIQTENEGVESVSVFQLANVFADLDPSLVISW